MVAHMSIRSIVLYGKFMFKMTSVDWNGHIMSGHWALGIGYAFIEHFDDSGIAAWSKLQMCDQWWQWTIDDGR